MNRIRLLFLGIGSGFVFWTVNNDGVCVCVS